MSEKMRSELIASIQESRKSYVLTYVLNGRSDLDGNISSGAVREIYNLICELKPLEKKSLDLFLYAHRGDFCVPWQIVTMIREVFDTFNVIVPYKAHGPATMIALGADAIIMGERGELSPIEISIKRDPDCKKDEGPAEYRPPSAADVAALRSLIESFGKLREKQRMDAFLRVMDKMDPLFVGRMKKRTEQTRADCLRLLQKRKRPFRAGVNARIVSRLFSNLTSPEHYITRTEATKEIGLKHVKTEKQLEPLFWELLSLYEQEFASLDGFSPESMLEEHGHEEEVFRDLKLGYVESTKRARLFRCNMKVRRIREYPPTIRFDPEILLPSLQVEAEPGEESLWAFIQEWLKSYLPELIDQSFEKFKKSLPVKGYERLPMAKGWTNE
jgi:Serine dehydrogenase proteinase